MSLGSRIRHLRRARGFRSIKALAEAAGIPYSVLYNVEHGLTANPQIETLTRLSAALQVPLDQLLADDTPPGGADADYKWLWRSRIAESKPSEIIKLRETTVEQRALWCMRQLAGVLPAQRLADLLGLNPEQLADILASRRAASPELVDLLCERFQVPVNFLIHGDPGPVDSLLQLVLRHPNSGAYLQMVSKAMQAQIPPEILDRQIDLLVAASAVRH
ncbi:transcriptional regulator with XRE-family HTH domain [Symbiobacterium terraclitae]|uniref:Transcriptional regulator with XRE-family HTH domain n=1 Tax=Symbiobacterium terraclitae TaxID=557451 RepID=A0ABS4JP11_9FIRM|nr:helix-turn-helix transcriptional regulator [Symbiobacterium terraclitae]MBP2017278.1 transcriptional regulator with XRE-family HTH domain [Symbiobacterium terraclitae]